MSALTDVEERIARLNRAEKAQLLRRVVSDFGENFPLLARSVFAR